AIINGTVVFGIDSLDSGEVESFSYKARVENPLAQIPQHIINTAIVESDAPDIDTTNNQTTYEIIATTDPVLDIVKISDKTTYELTDQIEYTIRITNNSSSNAYKLILEDALSKEFDYIPGSTTLNGESYNDPTGTYTLLWEFTELEVGSTLELKYKVRTNDTCVADNYSSIAQITWIDEEGAVFGPASDDCTIAVTDIKPIVTVPDIEEEDPIEEFVNNIKVLGASLINTGEGLIYIKAFVGLLLAMPLPLILIFGKHKTKKVKSSLIKYGTKDRGTKKKNLRARKQARGNSKKYKK
ncbi:MAG: hypothetical protein PHS44_08035, partial [Candidatus Dojkabacteria bacterium]|nr:hypothetical protein [Candidatus Dojkabacteria bacterium]